MPICHCGGSGVLQGLIRRFYKAVIQRCEAPKYLVNKRSFTFVQDDIKRHSEGIARRISLKKRAFANVQDDKKKAAFTLAEVLITLGIIGVVAAMTMPMIVENTKKQQTVVQLKKSYSVLSQAIKLSELENGSCDYWDYTLPVDQFVKKYLTKFLEIRETRVSDSGQNYKYLNGSPCAEALCTEASYVISVADGTNFVVSRCYWLDNGRVVLIDINGDKQPNTLGKDVFSFAIQPGVKVSPFGYGTFGLAGAPDIGDGAELSGAQYFGKYDRDVLLGGDTYACSNGNRGFWCAALILSDGWEIRDDYPW